MNVRLTRKAEADLASIAAHTLAEWGEERANRYIRGLLRAGRLLASMPGIGRTHRARHITVQNTIARATSSSTKLRGKS